MTKSRLTHTFLQPAQISAAIVLAFAVMGLTPAYAQNSTKDEVALTKGEATLNFVGADIESVIKAVGHYTNHTFIIDPRVKGTINLVSEKPVTKAEAFSLLTSVLRLQGFAVVTSGGFTKVVPEADAKLQAGPTQKLGLKGDQVATQVFRLNYESAPNLVAVLRPLISPNNTISANPGNNSLIITDYADNLRRIDKIIATLDAPAAGDLDIVPIRYAIASDIAVMVNRLMEPTTAGDSGRVTLLADARTNSVVIRAPSAARANLAKSLIDKLDQPSQVPGNVHVVYLRNADATKLAQTLRAVLAGDTGGQSASGGQSNSLSHGNAMGANPGMQPAQSSSSPQQSSLSAGGPGGFIQADQATNTLIVSASEPVYRNIRAVIDQLDARRAQVYIEALIVEITSNKAAELGIQWAGLSGNSNSSYRVGTLTSFASGGSNLANVAGGIAAATTGKTPDLSKLVSPSNGLSLGAFRQANGVIGLGALARALETDANANILSMPNLITLDNEEAKIIVGQNVPFVTGQYAGGVGGGATVNPFQTIERKDVGLQLRVRPQISQGGSVKMAIYQETSNVRPTSNAADIITDKRSIDTNVLVDDGQVIVLGGLIDDSGSDNVEQVPGLGSIPIIGNLFKYKSRQHNKRNLMVFLRPTIIRSNEQSVNLSSDRYDYMRDVQSKVQPPRTLILPNLGSDLMPQMKDGKLVGGPLSQQTSTPQNLIPNTTSETTAVDAVPSTVPEMVPAPPTPQPIAPSTPAADTSVVN